MPQSKCIFDALANHLADFIAAMSCRTPIDRAAPSLDTTRHVWRHVAGTTIHHKVACIARFLCAHRFGLPPGGVDLGLWTDGLNRLREAAQASTTAVRMPCKHRFSKSLNTLNQNFTSSVRSIPSSSTSFWPYTGKVMYRQGHVSLDGQFCNRQSAILGLRMV